MEDNCKFVKHGGFVHRLFLTFVGLLLVYVLFWVGTAINKNIKETKYIGYSALSGRNIAVEGVGRATYKPDSVKFDVRFQTEGTDAAEVAAANNKHIEGFKKEISPFADKTEMLGSREEYYTPFGSTILTMRVKKIENFGDVLKAAGKFGATEVVVSDAGSDGKEMALNEARKKAMEEAIKKVQSYQEVLGERAGRIGKVQYLSEYSADPYYGGMGGGIMNDSIRSYYGQYDLTNVGPTTSSDKEIEMRVNVTFELR